MTNATGRWKVGFSGVLLGLAVGCGGGAASSDEASAPEVERTEGGFIPVKESADKPGYCGYIEHGTDGVGNKIVDVERYFYPVINRLLGEDAELRRYTGLTEVSTCDAARQFVKANNEYQDQRAVSSLDKADLLAGFPILPAQPPKRDPNAPVEKILRGNQDPIEEVIGFGFAEGTKTQNCTGVRLAGALFLTASHCLLIADRAAQEPYLVSFPIAWVKRVVDDDPGGDSYETDPKHCSLSEDDIKKGRRCVSLQLDGYMNPNYAGSGDKRNDVAVLHVRPESQKAVRSVPNASNDFRVNVAFLSTVTPEIGDMVEHVGWGPDGNFEKDLTPDQYLLRAAVPLPISTRDGNGPSMEKGVYQGTWFSTKAAAGAQICKGDSGGPTYDVYRHVVGLSSLLASADTVHKSCARVGTDQFMSRVDYQALSFIPKAMLKLQSGSDSTLCTCAFVPSNSDPTGKNPEEPGSYIKCNVGCEDPASWVQ